MENPVVDPVCGTKLNPDTVKYKYRYLGRTYYFCSFDCTIIFDEEPERYKGDIEVDFPFEEGG
ncbi:Copper-transporting P-type ATPase [Anaerolineales bacterium]|nr:Copper-transporting P-type ATPase [Anaerolineales bacterium]